MRRIEMQVSLFGVACLMLLFWVAGCTEEGSRDALLAEPVDLIPFARLQASATRPRDPLPFSRDLEDAIATIRDDDPSTCWKVPVGEDGVVEIDLQPWLGRSVPLSSMSLAFEQGAPDDLRVELAEGCGSDASHVLDRSSPEEVLDLEGHRAGCVRLRVGAAVEVSLKRMELLGGDSGMDVPGPPVAADIPAVEERHAHCGVVEGFYGVPWSWREREQMVATLAANGMDTYIYGPKNDPLHRDRWRETYPAEDLRRFADIARLGGELGVRFYMGLSPFADFDPGEDIQILRGKLLGFLETGIHGLVLLADDIEIHADVKVDGSLGSAHVELVNGLYAELSAAHPELDLWFVPTVYSDERLDRWGEGSVAYLESLAGLDPGIEAMWTGPRTFSKTMSASDMERFCSATGRKPIIWDNYWANDVLDRIVGCLPLGTYAGRDESLPGAVAGICQNPQIQGASARLAISMSAYYLKNPSLPDPRRARERAAEIETLLGFGPSASHESDKDTLCFIMEVFEAGASSIPSFGAMELAIDDLQARLAGDDPPGPEDVELLLQLFSRMASFESELHHSGLAPDLVDELLFPAMRVRHEGELGLWSLALLGEKLAGRKGEEHRARAEEADSASRACRFVFSIEKIAGLFAAISERPEHEAGFARVEPGEPSPGACSTGRTLTWTPFVEAQEVLVHGLPLAVVADGRISWTPLHSGRYQGYAIAVNKQAPWGWGLVELSFTCSR